MMTKTTVPGTTTDKWLPTFSKISGVCILSFHGKGGDNDDSATILDDVERGLELPLPIFDPQLSFGVYDWGKQYLYAACKLVKEQGYNDVHVTGLSLGGMACFRLMHWNETELNWPKINILSVGIVCGKDDKYNYPAYAKHKIKLWHGKLDTICRFDSIVTCANKIEAVGGTVEREFREGIAHNAWSFAYNKDEPRNYFDWLLAQIEQKPKPGLYVDGEWVHESTTVVCDKRIEYIP